VRRRFPGLHKPDLSFSVIYCESDGAERSLDLVCKVRAPGCAALGRALRACEALSGACSQDEEQQQLWYHGLRASISKFKSMSTGSGAAQLVGVARAAVATQRWKAVRTSYARVACAATVLTARDRLRLRMRARRPPRRAECSPLGEGRPQAASPAHLVYRRRRRLCPVRCMSGAATPMAILHAPPRKHTRATGLQER